MRGWRQLKLPAGIVDVSQMRVGGTPVPQSSQITFNSDSRVALPGQAVVL